MFPSTTTINVPVIFCHRHRMKFLATQKQWRDSDYRVGEKKLWLFFFKKTQRKADQIWNKYKLCQLLLSDRFTAHFTPSNIDDLSKKIFLPILKLFKKISCSFWLTALQLMQTCAPFLLSWPQLSLWCFRPQCRKQQLKKLCDVADNIFLIFNSSDKKTLAGSLLARVPHISALFLLFHDSDSSSL